MRALVWISASTLLLATGSSVVSAQPGPHVQERVPGPHDEALARAYQQAHDELPRHPSAPQLLAAGFQIVAATDADDDDDDILYLQRGAVLYMCRANVEHQQSNCYPMTP